MRVDDLPVPTIGGDRPTTERWPAHLFIGVQRQPVSSYVYDDFTANYDDPEGDFTYDDQQDFPYDRYDLFCNFHGLTITSGTNDPEGRFEAGHVEMTLDNRDGSLSQYDASGRLVDYFPGRALDIWATIDGEAFWLFSGEITAWRERADDTIEAEAFDAFTRLNQKVPQWNPGNYGDTVDQRLGKIRDAFFYTGPTRFDHGTVTLHSFFTTATPLEEMQAVALSDGGILFTDADGTLTYRDRMWLLGRGDQPEIPIFSDNVCDAPYTVWDSEMLTDDDVIVNVANLTNVAKVSLSARNDNSVLRYGEHTLEHTADQWISTADGSDLANFLVSRLGDAYLRLEQFSLHLPAPHQDAWRVGIDRRLGDVVTWVHEQAATTGADLLVLNLIVRSINHAITPETWVATFATSRTVGSTIVQRYDRTTYRYDQGGVYVI